MSTIVDAWQGVLAAEQRAAFGYALLGPRLAGAARALARECQDLHASERDGAAGQVAALRATPRPPQGDYPDLYGRLNSPALLAATLEDGCAAAWRYLFTASSATAGRRRAQTGLTTSAVRATRWRTIGAAPRAATAFPGG